MVGMKDILASKNKDELTSRSSMSSVKRSREALVVVAMIRTSSMRREVVPELG
jgi:hypothetical protein